MDERLDRPDCRSIGLDNSLFYLNGVCDVNGVPLLSPRAIRLEKLVFTGFRPVEISVIIPLTSIFDSWRWILWVRVRPQGNEAYYVRMRVFISLPQTPSPSVLGRKRLVSEGVDEVNASIEIDLGGLMCR